MSDRIVRMQSRAPVQGAAIRTQHGTLLECLTSLVESHHRGAVLRWGDCDVPLTQDVLYQLWSEPSAGTPAHRLLSLIRQAIAEHAENDALGCLGLLRIYRRRLDADAKAAVTGGEALVLIEREAIVAYLRGLPASASLHAAANNIEACLHLSTTER